MTQEIEEDSLLEERHGDVLLLTMNRPKRHHALNRELSERLQAAFTAAVATGVRVVVLTGAGEKAFCAGADMVEASGVESDEDGKSPLPRGAGQAIDAVANCPLPVIAAINGFCYGGGAAIAVCCDILLSSDTATFRLPGSEYGLVVGAATLPRLIGSSKAKELIYTARKFDAVEAEKVGLLSRVLPQAELVKEAMAMATVIAGHSAAAVQGAKKVIDTATLDSEATALENSLNKALRGSPEQSERFRSATKNVTGR